MYIAMRMYIQRTLQRSIHLTMKRFTRQLMDNHERVILIMEEMIMETMTVEEKIKHIEDVVKNAL